MEDTGNCVLVFVLVAIFLLALRVVYQAARDQQLSNKLKEGFDMCEPKAKPEGDNPFCCPLGMSRDRQIPDGVACGVGPAGPIVPIACDKVPGWQPGMYPKTYNVSGPEAPPFEPLVPKKGRFTFIKPELRYDGIWSMKTDPNCKTKCCWSLDDRTCGVSTYGGDHLSPAPECSMFGKTIVEPAECAGLWPITPAPITYIYDCHERVPCDDRNIKCPVRV